MILLQGCLTKKRSHGTCLCAWSLLVGLRSQVLWCWFPLHQDVAFDPSSDFSNSDSTQSPHTHQQAALQFPLKEMHVMRTARLCKSNVPNGPRAAASLEQNWQQHRPQNAMTTAGPIEDHWGPEAVGGYNSRSSCRTACLRDLRHGACATKSPELMRELHGPRKLEGRSQSSKAIDVPRELQSTENSYLYGWQATLHASGTRPGSFACS